MNFIALILILTSTFIHATWNFFSKKSKGGIPFVWLFMTISTIVYAPFAVGIMIYQQTNYDFVDFLFIVGSMLVHLVYFLALQNGYKIGDFSIVYPIGRGSAPLISSIAAILILHEKPSYMTVIGIILIVFSVFLLTGGTDLFKKKDLKIPVIYGLIIGTAVATYTIIDKGAVSHRGISPLLLEYFSSLGQFMLLAPIALKNWKEVKFEWKNHKKEALIVGIFHSLAYILVLIALTFSSVIYVAPLRELSILIGVLLGTFFLSEGFGKRRIIASGFMILGVIVLSTS